MRITKIEMHSPTLEEPIDFSLQDASPQSRYLVQDIAGLDAEQIIPKFYGKGTSTGPAKDSSFYNMSLGGRNIVMKVSLNPQFVIGEGYSDIRDELYRAISATRTGMVDLQFKSGSSAVAHISGWISKLEVDHFTPAPNVKITVSCMDPMLRGVMPVIFDSIVSSNPILIPDSLSTAPHGFSMWFNLLSAVASLEMYDDPENPTWDFKITPSGGFHVGDKLYFSSEFTNKYLYIMRGATKIDVVDKIFPNSIWPIVFPGANYICFDAPSAVDFGEISFYPSYWGV